MNRYRAILLLLGLSLPCLAAEPATRPATTGPATRPAAPTYNPILERGRFLRIVGVDNELDEKEFSAHHGKPDSFVRSEDRWEGLLAFDKNANRTIDWFEADAYRRSRAAAGRQDSVSVRGPGRGQVPRRAEGATSRPTGRFARFRGRPGEGAAATAGGAESQAPAESGRREAFQRMAEAFRRRFDRDGDGELNEQEQAEFKEARVEIRQRFQARREERLRRFDADGDGELSEEERRAAFGSAGPGNSENPPRVPAEERRRQMAERIEQALQRRFDRDGDGSLNDEERAEFEQARERLREQFRARREEMRRRFDTDGDGELSEEERRAAFQRNRGRVRRRRARESDSDGDE